MGRAAGGELFRPRVVYDLDMLIKCSNPKSDSVKAKVSLGSLSSPNLGHTKNNRSSTAVPPSTESKPVLFLGNNDEKEVGQYEKKNVHSLKFESRFEGGNLRKAIQVLAVTDSKKAPTLSGW